MPQRLASSTLVGYGAIRDKLAKNPAVGNELLAKPATKFSHPIRASISLPKFSRAACSRAGSI